MFGFSKSSNQISDQYIFFHEDYSANDVSEALVGRKGYSLFKLRDMDVPVPDFFVIPPALYKKFLLSAFENKLADLLDKVKSPDIKELEKLILKGSFPPEFTDEFERAYGRLSGFSDTWVAIRSSVVYPAKPEVSFSGLFGTELNVRGSANLLDAIKQVYLSVFKNRVLIYAREHGVDIADIQMSIVVQRMIQPEVSGVAFTIDPITENRERMSIEAVFGLGDVIADGSITPDQYLLEKKDLEIKEKSISPQEWMKIRKPEDSRAGRQAQEEKIKISKTWSHQQKLEDSSIRDVAKIALIVEEKSKVAQSVEWVWESGNVWILQNKGLIDKSKIAPAKSVAPVTTKDSLFDYAIDIVKEEKIRTNEQNDNEVGLDAVKKLGASINDAQNKGSEKDIRKLSQFADKLKRLARMDVKSQSDRKDVLVREQSRKLGELGLLNTSMRGKLEFLLTGIGASNGEISGEVRVLKTPLRDDVLITKGTVIIIRDYISEMESLVIQAGGVIMDEGGLTSDVSITAREFGIPAVVGTGLASALLKDGDIVKIDGNVGSVYRVLPEDPKVREAAEAKRNAESIARQLEEQSIKVAAERVAAQKDPAVDNDPDAIEIDRSDEVTDNFYGTAVSTHVAKAPKAEVEHQRVITATKVLLQPEICAPVERYSSLIGFVDGVTYIDLDELMLNDKRHPLAYAEDGDFKGYSKQFEKHLDDYTDALNGNEVVVSIGSAPISRFKELVKGTKFEDKDANENAYGVQRYLNSPELMKRALAIIKKVRNVYRSRNLSFAVHSPMNAEMMKEFKKQISASGLKRTVTFNVYAVIDNPAEIILSEDIVAAGIDGIIINTPRLARQMQGLPFYGDSAKYDIGVNSVIKIVENAVKQVREKKAKVIVVAENNEKLINQCVEWGVYGVAVTPDFYHKAKKAVSTRETELIMRIGIVA